MDAGTLDLFEVELRKVVPDLQVKFKDESLVQKVVGALVFPFNPKYMTTYTSTFGSTVYFPSRAAYLENPGSSLMVLAHEFVHITDSKADGLFQVKYALPQAFAVLPLLVYGILAWSHAWILALPLAGYVVGALFARKSRKMFVVTVAAGLVALAVFGWALTGWALLTMLGLGFVAPWGAPWRREFELRGYGMNVAIVQWCSGRTDKDHHDFIAGQFTGPGYFYMCRDRAYIERSLEATRQQAEVGALQGIFPYSVVHDFLYHQRLTRSQNVA